MTDQMQAGEGMTVEGADAGAIDLAPHLKFKRMEGEAYTFRAMRDGEEVVHVFEPGEPMIVPGGTYTYASLFRGRNPQGGNLLPSGSMVNAK